MFHVNFVDESNCTSTVNTTHSHAVPNRPVQRQVHMDVPPSQLLHKDSSRDSGAGSFEVFVFVLHVVCQTSNKKWLMQHNYHD